MLLTGLTAILFDSLINVNRKKAGIKNPRIVESRGINPNKTLIKIKIIWKPKKIKPLSQTHFSFFDTPEARAKYDIPRNKTEIGTINVNIL